MGDRPFRTRAAEIVRQFVGDDSPGVAVLVAREGQVLLEEGYGLADVKGRVPVTPGTRFIIGSVTKQFTCLAVMMLQQEGRLDYDDPVGLHLPELPAWKDEVTLRHLMTHTAGVPEYLTEEFWEEARERDFDQEAVLARIRQFESLEFSPGEAWQYSNSGYVILGAVVEKVSGVDFATFLRRRIFQPLGMKDTLVGTAAQRYPGQAVGYRMLEEGGFEEAPYHRAVVGWADGNIISTVRDLYICDRALREAVLLPPEVLQQAFRPVRPEDPSFSRYGFGWFIGELRGVRVLQHAGGTLGYVARFCRFPDQDAVIVLLSNADGIDLEELAGALAEELLRDQMQPLKLLTSVPEEWLREKAGTYVPVRPRRERQIDVVYDEEKHRLFVPGRCLSLRADVELRPLSRDHFRLDGHSERYVTFLRQGDEITGARLVAGGRVANFRRIE